MTFLTIFSAPKPFTDRHIDTIQRNAIRSWQHLSPEVEVLLVGQEDGLEEVVQELGVTYLAQVKRNKEGTPLVSSIFTLAREASQSPLLAYLNADIMVTPDFVDLSRQVATQTREFLIVGQRWDLQVDQRWNFGAGWVERLESEVLKRGKLHLPQGSDYFVFPRHLFLTIPDFAIGRAGWDNWMIYYNREQGWPVIDATRALMVVHQNHDYSHLPDGKPHYTLEESEHNLELAGGPHHMYTILDTDKEFYWQRGQPGKIRPHRFSFLRLIRSLEVHFTPKDGSRRGLHWSVARFFRRWRRSLTGD